MRQGCRPARHDFVVLLDRVVDLDMNIGESPQKTAQKLFEVLRPVNVGSVLGLAVSNYILGAHRIHGFFRALVPDFLEPPAYKRRVLTHDADLSPGMANRGHWPRGPRANAAAPAHSPHRAAKLRYLLRRPAPRTGS